MTDSAAQGTKKPHLPLTQMGSKSADPPSKGSPPKKPAFIPGIEPPHKSSHSYEKARLDRLFNQSAATLGKLARLLDISVGRHKNYEECDETLARLIHSLQEIGFEDHEIDDLLRANGGTIGKRDQTHESFDKEIALSVERADSLYEKAKLEIKALVPIIGTKHLATFIIVSIKKEAAGSPKFFFKACHLPDFPLNHPDAFVV